jgi:hypothetical protein
MSVFEQGLERAAALLSSIPKATETAMQRALNKAAQAAREVGIKAIDARYAVTISDVRAAISTTQASADKLEVDVVAKSGSLPVDHFPHRPEVEGTGGRGKELLRAEIIRGAPKQIPGAFVAKLGGRRLVMTRTGGRTATGRATIRRLYTVPIANMLGVDQVRGAVEAKAAEVFEVQLGREIDRALGKASE